jgi:MFS transporter, CP family, cyanate transporter
VTTQSDQVRGQGWPARAGLGLAVTVLLVSLSMRPPISGVPPILEDLRDALQLSPTAVSLLTMLPLLSMGLFAPLGPPLRARLGEERALGAALTVLVLGMALRAAWPDAALFAGTLLAGGAIAVLNVLVPSLIKRRFPGSRVGVMMGTYTVGLSVGPAVAAAATVPIYQATGHSIPLALAAWALPPLVALTAWLPQLQHTPEPAGRAAAGHRSLLRVPLAWQVTLYMGLQSVNFFATLSWLPSLYRDRGLDAADGGFLVGLMSLVGTVPALVVPMLASRTPSQRRWVVLGVALTVTGMLGILLAPVGTMAVWASALGLGQGTNIGLALLLIVLRAADGPTSARLSSMAQTVGYTTASLGPLLIGLVHAATGGWGVPFAILVAAALAQLTAGLLAGRDRVVGAARPPARPEQAPVP